MDIKGKIIYFDNDQEFYDYCVNPALIPVKFNLNGIDGCYYTFNFTPQYDKAIEDNMTFIIKDDESKICKRGAVSVNTITKEIQNIEPWNKYEEYL